MDNCCCGAGKGREAQAKFKQSLEETNRQYAGALKRWRVDCPD